MVSRDHNRYPPDECCTPLGLPVEPDVYRMKSGCSALSGTASQASACPSTTSCSQTSRPSFQSIFPPVRLYTMTLRTDSHWPMAKIGRASCRESGCQYV